MCFPEIEFWFDRFFYFSSLKTCSLPSVTSDEESVVKMMVPVEHVCFSVVRIFSWSLVFSS